MWRVVAEISEKKKLVCKALIAHNFNQRKAYQEIYPKSSNETADVNCSKLLRETKVQKYLNSLITKKDKDDLVTIEEVIVGLKQDIADAKVAKQYSAVIKARELLGKYKAMWTDRKILSGEGEGGAVKVEFINKATK